jgi:hypothetical protein
MEGARIEAAAGGGDLCAGAEALVVPVVVCGFCRLVQWSKLADSFEGHLPSGCAEALEGKDCLGIL